MFQVNPTFAPEMKIPAPSDATEDKDPDAITTNLSSTFNSLTLNSVLVPSTVKSPASTKLSVYKVFVEGLNVNVLSSTYSVLTDEVLSVNAK